MIFLSLKFLQISNSYFIVDLITGNYKLLDINREDLLNDCFKDIPLPEIESKADDKIVFYASLSPYFAREFLQYLIWTLCNIDAFFICGPVEFYLFLPFANFKQIMAQPRGNYKEYTTLSVHRGSLVDFEVIDLDLDNICHTEKVEYNKINYTVLDSTNFELSNRKPFVNTEMFIFVRMKPKDIVRDMDADFRRNYL